MDKIYNMIRILEKRGTIHHLERDFIGILMQAGIIESKYAPVEMKLYFKDRPQCFFSARVLARYNTIGEDLSIMVRPDFNEKDRVMRMLIQVGIGEDSVFEKYSDEDHVYESDEAVFDHEMKILEAFLYSTLSRLPKLARR